MPMLKEDLTNLLELSSDPIAIPTRTPIAIPTRTPIGIPTCTPIDINQAVNPEHARAPPIIGDSLAFDLHTIHQALAVAPSSSRRPYGPHHVPRRHCSALTAPLALQLTRATPSARGTFRWRLLINLGQWRRPTDRPVVSRSLGRRAASSRQRLQLDGACSVAIALSHGRRRHHHLPLLVQVLASCRPHAETLVFVVAGGTTLITHRLVLAAPLG